MLTKAIIYFFKRGLHKSIKTLFKTQYENKDSIYKLRDEKFKKLINHVRENVPYYSDKLDEIHDIKDLYSIDFLTKKDIAENSENLKPNNLPTSRLIKNSTSGSTGESTIFYSDALNYNLKAAHYRGDTWAGLEIDGHAMYLWGAERDIEKKTSLKGELKRLFFAKKKVFSTYHMREDDFKEYFNYLKNKRPDVIISYPTPLFRFAEYIDKNNLQIPKLKGIITSAETLFPFQRDYIEKIFNVKIFNRYGAREVGHIASECKYQNGLHYNADRFIIEIVNPDGSHCENGELGEIVITDLDNFAFPFLRYKIGDLGSFSKENECPCGIKLPKLSTIEGRVFDLVYGLNGNVVGGTFWTLLRNKIKGWNKFQIIQEEKDSLLIIVEDNESIETDFKEKVLREVKEKLGEEMKITIRISDNIPLTKSGKHRWIISKISPYGEK